MPFIIPPVLTNLRVGFVIGLIVLTYGESYGFPRESCLGYWFSETTNYYRLQSLVALIFFMSLLVVAFEAILKVIERTLLPYKFAEVRLAVSNAFRASAAEEKRNCLELYEQARKARFARPVWMELPWTSKRIIPLPFKVFRNPTATHGCFMRPTITTPGSANSCPSSASRGKVNRRS